MTSVGPGPTGGTGNNNQHTHAHGWRLQYATAAGLLTWALTHDANLAVAVAGLVVSAFPPSSH